MYSTLKFDNLLNNVTLELLHSGRFITGIDGRLQPAKAQGAFDSPWIFANYGSRNKFCGWWNEIYCGKFKVIPSHCRFACWKTVIRPRNVLETFELLETLRRLDLPSKCGMDLRDYTYGAWGGFIYGDSLPIGRKYYHIVREAVPADIPIILKRGCTEMERMIPSDRWDELDDHTEKEAILNDRFHFDEALGEFRQAEWAKARIKENWIKWAIKIGEPEARTAAERYSSDPNIWQRLVVHSIPYHVEEDTFSNDIGKKAKAKKK